MELPGFGPSVPTISCESCLSKYATPDARSRAKSGPPASCARPRERGASDPTGDGRPFLDQSIWFVRRTTPEADDLGTFRMFKNRSRPYDDGGGRKAYQIRKCLRNNGRKALHGSTAPPAKEGPASRHPGDSEQTLWSCDQVEHVRSVSTQDKSCARLDTAEARAMELGPCYLSSNGS
jgi:hypothetical protein